MNNNKLIKVLQYYPYITQIMYILGLIIIYEPLESGNAFINMWRKSADLLVNLEIVSIYPIILFVFNIIMIMVVIRNAINMMESNVTSVEMIEIALKIKKKHQVIFITFIISGLITIRVFALCFWLFICGWFMIVQSGIISCAGLIKDYTKNNLKFNQMIKYIVIQFIPFADVRFDNKYINKSINS